MASYSVARVKSATLSTTTVDTITVTDETCTAVAVWNRVGAADIVFTTGLNGSAATPTSLGDDCYVVGPGQEITVPFLFLNPNRLSRDVKVLGNGNAYTVTGAK